LFRLNESELGELRDLLVRLVERLQVLPSKHQP
jgi:hypothetical protein